MTENVQTFGKELFIASLFLIQMQRVMHQNDGMILRILYLEKKVFPKVIFKSCEFFTAMKSVILDNPAARPIWR